MLTVGRLVPEKGFDLLLEAFAMITHSFPTLRLRIAGSGPCQTSLHSQSVQLRIDDRIEFLGDVPFPAQYFADALAFVLASREDEMPNALLEAAAAGLPIIATPASAGVAGLLDRRRGVWLAREATEAALGESLRAAVDSLRPGERFSHEWIEPFALSPALAAYQDLFDWVMKGERG